MRAIEQTDKSAKTKLRKNKLLLPTIDVFGI
jgi:hypothetical protein